MFNHSANNQLRFAVCNGDGVSVSAQDSSATIQSELVSTARDYVAVFNKHDSETLAQFWAPSAIFIDRETGGKTQDRETLQSDFDTAFRDRPSMRLESVRVVAPNVAHVHGTATVVTADADPNIAAFSPVFVKQDGRWLIDVAEEGPQAAPPTPREALRDLDGLIGSWVDDVDAISVESGDRWAADQSLLVRAIRTQKEDGGMQKGTQVIGWDPLQQQIHSWAFFSDGSFGEGIWSKNGTDWIRNGWLSNGVTAAEALCRRRSRRCCAS